MEDILAIVFVLAIVAAVVACIRFVQRKTAERKEREYREMQEQIEATRKWREAQRAKAVKNTPPPKTINAVGSGVNVGKTTYAPSPTQSINQYQDNFMSDVAMGMVINSLLNSTHSSQSGTVTEDRDTGAVRVDVKESSWGFDDSDSRKSASSSFSSSDSSSSWSSSSSSSSDSGPSSDW